jgi:hypothetical protein
MQTTASMCQNISQHYDQFGNAVFASVIIVLVDVSSADISNNSYQVAAHIFERDQPIVIFISRKSTGVAYDGGNFLVDAKCS